MYIDDNLEEDKVKCVKIENRHLAGLASEQLQEEIAPASRPFDRNLDENYGHLAARPLENGTRPLCWSVPG